VFRAEIGYAFILRDIINDRGERDIPFLQQFHELLAGYVRGRYQYDVPVRHFSSPPVLVLGEGNKKEAMGRGTLLVASRLAARA
jgi:hypothetical protein